MPVTVWRKGGERVNNRLVKILPLIPPTYDGQENIAELCITMAEEACEAGATLLAFPALCLARDKSLEDMIAQCHLDDILSRLADFVAGTAHLPCVSVMGLPVCHEGKLYDCGAVCQGGVLLGIVPKAHIPRNSANMYFTPAPKANLTYEFQGSYVQFGTKQIFVDTSHPHFRFCLEIGEDASVMIPPSTYATMAGATVICHLSEAQETVREQQFLLSQSARSTAVCVSVGKEALLAVDGEVLDIMDGVGVDLEAIAYQRRRRDTFQNDTAGEYTEVYFSSEKEYDSLYAEEV